MTTTRTAEEIAAEIHQHMCFLVSEGFCEITLREFLTFINPATLSKKLDCFLPRLKAIIKQQQGLSAFVKTKHPVSLLPIDVRACLVRFHSLIYDLRLAVGFSDGGVA